jgi:hypothetical protein
MCHLEILSCVISIYYPEHKTLHCKGISGDLSMLLCILITFVELEGVKFNLFSTYIY